MTCVLETISGTMKKLSDAFSCKTDYTRTQAAISQKPDKESLTPPPPLNPTFLTPPPTVETSSQQGPKRKRRRIQFIIKLTANS